MWKIVLGFIVFAAIALFVLMKSGGNIDLTGEKHDVTGGHEAEAAASAVLPETAASAASAVIADAVVAPASGASQ